MYEPDRQQSVPQPSSKSECCTEHECESGLRNNYFEGKRLTTDSFRVEQRYLLGRRQLLNRAIHGTGVVFGYPVSNTPAGRLTIGPGLALDDCGRELLQTGTAPVKLEDLLILDKNGARTDLAHALAAAGAASIEKPPVCWLLSVHYAEQYSGPVTVNDSCHCEHQEWEHTCETVRYSLTRIPCADCCREPECELTCDCANGPCCDDEVVVKGGKEQLLRGKQHKRGGCQCLCEHLTNLQPGTECDSLCEIEEPCARVRVDLRRGIRLACVALARDGVGAWALSKVIDACGPRRLVKRNDLLFDLIRGCDLTRIIEIGWGPWHRKAVSFNEFSNALGLKGDVEYITDLFWVTFSRPVRKDTLQPDCFAMTVMSIEREGGWLQTFRVPIVRVETTPQQKDDPIDHVRGATIVVDGAWVEDGVRGRRSLFIGYETQVEIEVRGDLIVDCNGQTVDANAVGLSPTPTGNGTPGGTFVSSFRVAAREVPARASGAADRKGAS